MKVMYKVGSMMKAVPDRDPRRYWLDEKDCERLTRSEFNALRSMLTVVSFFAEAKKDLDKRLECVPYGRQRMNLAFGAMKALMDDVIGTITKAQAQQLQNTINDMEVRITPKVMPMGQTVIMDLNIAKDLTDCAKEKCIGCTEDGESCRKCKLYQIMEATTPLEDYGDGMLCPYNLATWEE